VRGALDRRTEGLRRLYAETLAEMKKINWPDRETTKNLTGVVIAISAVLGVLLGGLDFLLRALFEALP
jgi:preprotein translocase subunit SecE